MDRLRLDKWLWAARFFKTRAIAAEEIGKGRVSVNEQVAKASREVKAGDVLAFRQGSAARTVVEYITATHEQLGRVAAAG